jgi:GntR family transcriptional regulator
LTEQTTPEPASLVASQSGERATQERRTAPGPDPLCRVASALSHASANGWPKHRRLYEAVLAGLACGDWKPGDRFPTEVELAAALPLSLGTIQRAVKALAEAGVLTRGRRRGSAFALPDPQMPDPLHCRFHDPQGRVLPVTTRITGRRVVTRSGPWCALKASVSDSIVRIDRVFRVDERFNVVSRFYASRERFPELLDRPIADLAAENFKHLFAREFGRPVASLAQTVQSLTFAGPLAKVLGKRSALRVTIVAHGADGLALYHLDMYVPEGAPPLAVGSRDATPWIPG